MAALEIGTHDPSRQQTITKGFTGNDLSNFVKQCPDYACDGDFQATQAKNWIYYFPSMTKKY